MSLFTACGELRDVKLEENCLKVTVLEEILYNILTKEENINKINLILNNIYPNINVNFILIKKDEDILSYNIARLKDIFGSEFEIID